MAVLYAEDGSIVRGVKNLGWLLRNWKHARSVSVEPVNGGPNTLAEARLVVRMDAQTCPGGVARYETLFNSSRLLWDWLRRPVLSGLPLHWGDSPVSIIGDSTPYPGTPAVPAK